MSAIKIMVAALSMAVMVTSCKKEDPLGNVDNIPGLGGDTWTPGVIDDWILDTLTVPYNISVKYKWDQGELQADFGKILVPPKEEKIIPLMGAIKDAWIYPYVAEAGVLFFKNISPKFFILVGSPAYERGAVKLGTAEGGRKVVLYAVNEFRIKGMADYQASDTETVIKIFWVINHEFAHILDQNIKFPVEFSQSSASSYTSDWLNVTEQDAINEGFISQYAISGAIDDWAETVSLMLVRGPAWFDNLVNSINYTGTTPNGTTAATARARLRQKESVVVSYFKKAWNIDYRSLQTRIKTAINALLY